MLADLQIGDSGDDHDHDHDHEHEHSVQEVEDTYAEAFSVDHTCFEAHDLLEIFGVNHSIGIREDEFVELSPALLQQILQGCAHAHSDEVSDPSPAESKDISTLSD